jgi:hypothetical protein
LAVSPDGWVLVDWTLLASGEADPSLGECILERRYRFVTGDTAFLEWQRTGGWVVLYCPDPMQPAGEVLRLLEELEQARTDLPKLVRVSNVLRWA